MTSIHQFKVEGIDGKQIDFADFKGKKLLVVNVASECGYTSQYAQLQELYDNFRDTLTIVGFPSNDFGGQEPGTDEEIKNFCSLRFGVTFPLTTKVPVKGSNATPIYKWLTQKSQNGVMDSQVRWNFHKYLLDEDGRLVDAHASAVSPLDDPILSWVNP
ncbi:MAG: glutathione peroxidase [Bacteroidota bacterium]